MSLIEGNISTSILLDHGHQQPIEPNVNVDPQLIRQLIDPSNYRISSDQEASSVIDLEFTGDCE